MTKSTTCKKCGHNMGRSVCKVDSKGWKVRCNKCKTTYTITLK